MKWLDAVQWRWRVVAALFYGGLVALYFDMFMEVTK